LLLYSSSVIASLFLRFTCDCSSYWFSLANFKLVWLELSKIYCNLSKSSCFALRELLKLMHYESTWLTRFNYWLRSFFYCVNWWIMALRLSISRFKDKILSFKVWFYCENFVNSDWMIESLEICYDYFWILSCYNTSRSFSSLLTSLFSIF
jgi:hypothetical protein